MNEISVWCNELSCEFVQEVSVWEVEVSYERVFDAFFWYLHLYDFMFVFLN